MTDEPRAAGEPAVRHSLAPDATVVSLRGSPTRAAADSARLGRYPLLGSLGAGGMGEVLEALDPDLGRRIAAKVIRGAAGGTALRKFVQEAQVTGQLDHPNIVPVYELGLEDSGRVYFTMKKVRGRDLAAVLAEAGEQSLGGLSAAAGTEPWWALLPILVKVCDAIEFAHSRGVIHRDLKPANIMVVAFGEVQVMDWGLAKLLDTGAGDQAAERLTLGADLAQDTMEGAVAGTPSYMPPEQARGEIAELDERADIYALGAMLYEMLALRPPYTGDSTAQVLAQVAQGNLQLPTKTAPPHLRERIPWELERIVQQAMAPAKADRYGTVAALREDLQRFLTGQAVAAAQYSPWQLLKKWAARNRAAVAAAAAIAAVTVIATVVAFVLVTRQKNHALAAQQREAKERGKAQAARDEAKRRLADFESLSDVKRMTELDWQSADLGPQRFRLPALRRWLTEAREIQGRGAGHRATRTRLEQTTGRSRVEDWQLGLVRRLLDDLNGFATKIAQVAAWEERARALPAPARTPAWARAAEAIRSAKHYGGLALEPQEGLAPLGPDPQSGLWEFLHTGSGAPPLRGSDGRWKITGQTGIVLVLIPRGTFRMGAEEGTAGPNRDPEADADERPVHPVELAPFFIGKYELTQGQWKRLTGASPSRWPPGKRAGRHTITAVHPVEQVSWDDCRRALAEAGLSLPSEAQWERAARAGTQTTWCTGNDAAALGGAGNLADASLKQATGGKGRGESWDDGHAVHAPVGSFRANPFGLHDCIGNVWEWCRDPYYEGAYRRRILDRQGRREFPGDAASAARVTRGGGWSFHPFDARSANRDRYARATRDDDLGCRPARRIH